MIFGETYFYESDKDIIVFGSLSGLHTGTTHFNQNEQSVLFDPDKDFWPGEQVQAIMTHIFDTTFFDEELYTFQLNR